MQTRTALLQAFVLIILTLCFGVELYAQPSIIPYADGLITPIGIQIDDQGRLWVGEHGTGQNDGRVSIITTDGEVHPFLVGLPSEEVGIGEIAGTNHLYFDGDGNLMIVQGEGTDSLSASILLVDTTGFVPGVSSQLDVDAVHTAHDIGSFVHESDEGFEESNPYALAVGPDDDLFIVDAAANAVIRRSSETGDLEVFATFPDVPNNTGVGPLMVDAVPTGIVFAEDRFYVGSLTGFPFASDAASVYEVDLDGNVSVFRDNLTTLVELTLDPRDGELVALQIGEFRQPPPAPPFEPGTGVVLKLRTDGSVDTLAAALNLPTGLRFSANGDLYVSSFTDGEILRVDAASTGIEDAPELPGPIAHFESYPNPFQSETRIIYALTAPSPIRISVVNVLGREVRLLHDAFAGTGTHEVLWDGRDDAGLRLTNGIYFYRISAPQGTATGMIVQMR